jgi:predicted N-formylglutamate amidohydrolase
MNRSTDVTVPAVTVLNETGASPYVLLCEHASNYIPEEYANLGLPEAELTRHIAWDIGAADVARLLSATLDAPLFLSGYSRLLIDCNRPLHAATSITPRSEATNIPGNHDLTAAQRVDRAERYYAPFQRAVVACLDARAAASRRTIVIGVHSFTPTFLGVARPWQIGVLYAGAVALGHGLVTMLTRDATLTIGDNQPYQISTDTDHTVPVHGDGRGLPAALIELRQDLVGTAEGAAAWAARLVPALREVERQLP